MAVLRIDRPGSVGTPDTSRRDGLPGEVVTVSLVGTGPTAPTLSFWDVAPSALSGALPAITSIAALPGTTASWQFTSLLQSDVAYGIRCAFGDGSELRREYHVVTLGHLPFMLFNEGGDKTARLDNALAAQISASTDNTANEWRSWCAKLNALIAQTNNPPSTLPLYFASIWPHLGNVSGVGWTQNIFIQTPTLPPTSIALVVGVADTQTQAGVSLYNAIRTAAIPGVVAYQRTLCGINWVAGQTVTCTINGTAVSVPSGANADAAASAMVAAINANLTVNTIVVASPGPLCGRGFFYLDPVAGNQLAYTVLGSGTGGATVQGPGNTGANIPATYVRLTSPIPLSVWQVTGQNGGSTADLVRCTYGLQGRSYNFPAHFQNGQPIGQFPTSWFLFTGNLYRTQPLGSAFALDAPQLLQMATFGAPLLWDSVAAFQWAFGLHPVDFPRGAWRFFGAWSAVNRIKLGRPYWYNWSAGDVDGGNLDLPNGDGINHLGEFESDDTGFTMVGAQFGGTQPQLLFTWFQARRLDV